MPPALVPSVGQGEQLPTAATSRETPPAARPLYKLTAPESQPQPCDLKHPLPPLVRHRGCGQLCDSHHPLADGKCARCEIPFRLLFGEQARSVPGWVGAGPAQTICGNGQSWLASRHGHLPQLVRVSQVGIGWRFHLARKCRRRPTVWLDPCRAWGTGPQAGCLCHAPGCFAWKRTSCCAFFRMAWAKPTEMSLVIPW